MKLFLPILIIQHFNIGHARGTISSQEVVKTILVLVDQFKFPCVSLIIDRIDPGIWKDLVKATQVSIQHVEALDMGRSTPGCANFIWLESPTETVHTWEVTPGNKPPKILQNSNLNYV